MVVEPESLKDGLDQLYGKYSDGWLETDPVSVPHRYKNPRDIEVAGFISALFSYGKVSLFLPVIEKIMDFLGPSPADRLATLKAADLERMDHVYYRFQTFQDITSFLGLLAKIIRDHGSLRTFFMKGFHSNDRNTFSSIALFNTSLHELMEMENIRLSYGINQLIPVSGRGAMKRLNMFLRWMTRKDKVDFGIWTEISPSQLVIPLDTHIHKLAGFLGLSGRATADFTTAIEITDNLRKICPEDPVKYDFALTRLGMFACSSYSKFCHDCLLKNFCSNVTA